MESEPVKELPVTIKSCITAYPAKETPQHTLFLSNVDLTVVFMVDSVYFYSSGSEKAFELLSKAFQEAIVAFYPFAGRLALDQTSQRLVLNANSAGVPFVDATAGVSIQDLGDLTQPNSLFRNLVFTPGNVTSFSDWPLATVQVTRFKCGGFSLGLSVNHALCDGFGIIQFLTHFRNVARGEGFEPPTLNFDRSMLKARSPPAPKIDFGDVSYKSSEVPGTQSFSTIEDMLSANLSSSNYVVPDLVSKAVHVSSTNIKYLKELAMRDGILKKCSTFDVVAAYLWKLRTAAIGLPPDHESVMFMAVDVSSKAKPPLPPGFFGNQAFTVYAKLKSKELLKKSLPETVRLIQEALSSVDDEYVRSWIDWSEIHRGIPKFNGGFYVSSWWKFPFYEMDFGWGKPIYTGPVLTQRVEFALILPVPASRPDGGVEILLTLNPEQMVKFETLVDFPTM